MNVRFRPSLSTYRSRPVLGGLLVLAVSALVAGCLPVQAGSESAPSDSPENPAAVRYLEESFASINKEEDIEYGSAADLQDGQPTPLTLDLYQPEDDSSTQRPAVIWVHGGAFVRGDKGDKLPAYMATYFAKRGYVAVSINYRLLEGRGCSAEGGGTPTCFNAAVEAVHDAQTAVRWLRANADQYGIDADRIAIAGESAGGIVATGVGVSSDFATDGSNPGHSSAVRAWVSISGGLPQGIFVDGTDSPGLLFAGTNDKVVPYQWSVETADAMQAAGVPAIVKVLDGAGHVPWGEYGDLFEDEGVAFLADHLDLDATP